MEENEYHRISFDMLLQQFIKLPGNIAEIIAGNIIYC